MKTSSRDPTLISMGNIKADRCSFIDDWEDDDVSILFPSFEQKNEIRTGILSIVRRSTRHSEIVIERCALFGLITNVIRCCVFGKKVKLKTNIREHLEANCCSSANLRVRGSEKMAAVTPFSHWRPRQIMKPAVMLLTQWMGRTQQTLSLLFCLIPNNPSAIPTESPAGGRDLSKKTRPVTRELHDSKPQSLVIYVIWLNC